MEVKRIPKGDLVFRSMPGECATALRGIPALLESDDPRVRDRLLPRTYGDHRLEKEWRRIGVPELEHLFASRTRLIEKDMETLLTDRSGTFKRNIQSIHENAWLSGLNAARHALFILNDLEDADIERHPYELQDPDRAEALLYIHLMAWMQELIMKADEALNGRS